MKIDGELARDYQAILLDSMETLPGELVSGDDQTGEVFLRDKTGEIKSRTYGPRRIRIVHKYHR